MLYFSLAVDCVSGCVSEGMSEQPVRRGGEGEEDKLRPK